MKGKHIVCLLVAALLFVLNTQAHAQEEKRYTGLAICRLLPNLACVKRRFYGVCAISDGSTGKALRLNTVGRRAT